MSMKVYTAIGIASIMSTFRRGPCHALRHIIRDVVSKPEKTDSKPYKKAADGDQLKKYGDSKTSLKSKSPRSGKGGNDNDGKDL